MLKTVIQGAIDRLAIIALVLVTAYVVAGMLHEVSVASCGTVCR